MPTCPPPKRPVVGSETPPPQSLHSSGAPFLPPGEAQTVCSLRASLPPTQRFSAKACGGGESPPPTSIGLPRALAFLFIFLLYRFFPCVKGDLPLTL